MCLLFILLQILLAYVCCPVYAESADSEIDEKIKHMHKIYTLNILLYILLLTLMVLTTWMFKHTTLRFLHETGLAIIYGLIVGAILSYGTENAEISHLNVIPASSDEYKLMPPDTLWIQLPNQNLKLNKTYAYSFQGGIIDVTSNEIEQKATFDPEIFFDIALPLIIFHAGYSMKRKHFFRNLGSIMTFAFLGTVISAVTTGCVVYGFVQLLSSNFNFSDCLYFGAIISATDPVTVIAIFNDLRVDVNLFALVFGESILNDAVAIVLTSAIQNYENVHRVQTAGFETQAFLLAMLDFLRIFSLSFLLGSIIGCCTALLMKFTRLRNFPLLESCLFFLMSYITFLVAESADLSGIVSLLFCGMCQAHYTFNNLSKESKYRTKDMFELLNFLAENFVFCYLGVSIFTFTKHHWDAGFIFAAFLATILGRAFCVYPLSFLLNLGRKNKLPMSYQHILFFSGLRGAMAFALAIRNTVFDPRQAVLTATSVIIIISVFVFGGTTSYVLKYLKIPTNIVDEEDHMETSNSFQSSVRSQYLTTASSEEIRISSDDHKSYLAKFWSNFDNLYMKPFLTHSRPTLMDTLPPRLHCLARVLTSTQQLTQERFQSVVRILPTPPTDSLEK